MLMCYQVLLIAKKQKKNKEKQYQKDYHKKYFQGKLNKPYTCNICGKSNQWRTVLTNQDMKKVESARVLKVKSNWIILI